jgi:hypothetical protein
MAYEELETRLIHLIDRFEKSFEANYESNLHMRRAFQQLRRDVHNIILDEEEDFEEAGVEEEILDEDDDGVEPEIF